MSEIDPRDMENGEADAANDADYRLSNRGADDNPATYPLEGKEATPAADLPYKADTSDGTTAQRPADVADDEAVDEDGNEVDTPDDQPAE